MDWQRLTMYRSCNKELVAKNSVQYSDELLGTLQCQNAYSVRIVSRLQTLLLARILILMEILRELA
jgi:hypothetical protein